MPLEILAAMVVVGVGLSVLLVRWAFGDNRARLAGSAETIDILRTDYPDIRAAGGKGSADAVLMAEDHHNALIRLEAPQGHFGYVQAFGSKYVTRLLQGSDVRNYRLHGDGVLRIHLADFSLPRIDITFGGSKQGGQALKLLEEMTK
ncbi:MAG: hypothetical protein M9908_13435 [Phyllobacteriaceae bacterium]|nr:hypothetical protein [Phyllobacteriaceae bacterium]